MEAIGNVIRGLADDVPGLVRGATVNANSTANNADPKNAKGAVHGHGQAPQKPGQPPAQAGQPLPKPEEMDPIEWIDENILCNLYLNLGIGLVPAGLGLAAGGAKMIGMNGAANTMKKIEHLTFADVGRATGTNGIFSKVSEGVMHGASYLTKPLHWLGITDMAAASHASNFASQAAKMQGAAHHINRYMPGIAGHGELNSAMSDVMAHLKGPVHAVDFEGLTSAVQHAQGVADKVGHTGLSKALGTLEKSAGKAETSLFFSKGWKNLEHNTREAAGHMGGANLWHGLMNATFLAQAAVMDYKDVRDLHKSIKSLRTMHAKLSHQKEEDVSTLGLLFGKVSEPVAAARAELFKEFGPALVLDVANSVVNVKVASNNKFGASFMGIAKLVALPMANMMIARGLLGGSLLPAYDAVNKLQKEHQPVPPELYAKLLGNSSKELYKLGGETSNFTKALSMFYAQHQASADTVMKEVDNGTMHKRMVVLERSYQQYIKAHPEQDPERKLAEKNRDLKPHSPDAVAHAHQEQDHSHGTISQRDRLNGHRPERKVVGPATERLVRADSQPQPAQALPPMG